MVEPGTPNILPEDGTPVDGALPTLERQLQQLTQTLNGLKINLAVSEDSGERLSKVEEAVKWATPWRSLLALASFLIVGLVGAVSAVRSFARTTIIETVQEAHETEIEPSVETVTSIKRDLKTTSDGVGGLVRAKERERVIQSLEFQLKLHEDQYAELMADWNAKKAARRNPGEKPQKTPEHLALEAALRAAITSG